MNIYIYVAQSVHEHSVLADSSCAREYSAHALAATIFMWGMGLARHSHSPLGATTISETDRSKIVRSPD